MPYTMEDFRRDFARDHIDSLTVEERLAGLTPDQLVSRLTPDQLVSRLTPDQLLAGLTPAQKRLLRERLNQRTIDKKRKKKK